MEEWKDIVGYEGCYQISSYGRVKSLKRKVCSKNGSFRELPEKIITPLLSSNGYLNIIASKKQIRETMIIHELVAKYFIGEKPDGLVIDHIDGNKTNNYAINLRYVSIKENLRKRKDAKLTKEKTEEILSLIGVKPQSQIAKQFGISQSMVSMINTNRRWANG